MTKAEEKFLIRIFLGIFVVVGTGFVYLLISQSKALPVHDENTSQVVSAQVTTLLDEAVPSGVQLELPLPNATSDGYVLEQDLRAKELTITVYEVDGSYYEKNRLKGDINCFSSVTYEYLDGQGVFVFRLSDVYDIKEQIVDGQLDVSLTRPQDSGTPIVVLEGGCFENTDYEVLKSQGVCVLDNGDCEVANEVRADFYVICQTLEASPEGPDKVTIYYNNRFAIPDFDSYDFALYLSDALRVQDATLLVDVAYSEDERLASAMEPAVYLQYQPGDADEQGDQATFCQAVMKAVAQCVQDH